MSEGPLSDGGSDPQDRETLLRDLERWSRLPMLVLSAIWLGLPVVEFSKGNSRALEVLGVAVWTVF